MQLEEKQILFEAGQARIERTGETLTISPGCVALTLSETKEGVECTFKPLTWCALCVTRNYLAQQKHQTMIVSGSDSDSDLLTTFGFVRGRRSVAAPIPVPRTWYAPKLLHPATYGLSPKNRVPLDDAEVIIGASRELDLERVKSPIVIIFTDQDDPRLPPYESSVFARLPADVAANCNLYWGDIAEGLCSLVV